MPHCWLSRSEPSEVSVDDALAVLFYHSSCAEPGIVGIARVASGA